MYFNIYLFYVSEWVYGYHIFAGACEREKSVSDPQELELQMFMSF